MTPEEASEPAEKPKTPPSTAGMTTKVVKGSLWTLAGQVAPLAVSLVATPFVIRLLGAESYGVLILIGLIPTYLGFADFGMSMASTKFGSEAYAEGDEEKEARIVRTAALIALMTSVPVAAGLMIFASPVIALFNVPEALQAEAVTALRIAAGTFVINFLCGIFNTPQLARLRMDLNTFINAGSRILGLIATPIVLYLGYGIIGAVTVLLAASLLNLLGHLIISARLLPSLVATTFDVGLSRFLLRFGLPLAYSSVAAVLLVNAEKLVLSTVSSVRALAYYTIAFTFASMATMFSNAMSQSLVPAFSQLRLPESKTRLNDLYSRGLRLNLIGLFPILFFSAIFAKPFFTVWAGADFGAESTIPFYILIVGLFFHLSSYVSGALIIASGRTDVIAKLFWAELLPFLLLVGILTANFGAVGAAIAWSLRVIVESFILVGLARKVGDVRINLGGNPAIFLIGVLLLSPPLGVIWLFEDMILLAFILAPVSAGAYAFLIWRTLLQKSEKQWMFEKLHLA